MAQELARCRYEVGSISPWARWRDRGVHRRCRRAEESGLRLRRRGSLTAATPWLRRGDRTTGTGRAADKLMVTAIMRASTTAAGQGLYF